MTRRYSLGTDPLCCHPNGLILLPMLWAMIILVNMSFNGGLRRR
ncbi:hypothetical protein ACTQ49_02195 [Luteococcus sp. Sow4_B9]